MSKFVLAVPSSRASLSLTDHLDRHWLRVTLACACTIVVLAAGLSSAQSEQRGAGDQPPAGAIPRTGAAPSLSRFVAESRETLKTLQERMAGLAARVMADLDKDLPAAGDVASQSLAVESAKAGFQHAQLAREAAEIAIKEYKEGIFKREKTICDTEIKLAEAELASADAAPQARDRYAKFKQIRTGSAADIARGWQLEVGEIVGQLQARKARFVLDQAQSKLRVLLEYEKGKHEKTLMANVEKARSNELARHATWQLEQSKLTKFKSLHDPAPDRFLRTAQWKQTLALLDRAIPIEERLSARLDQIKADSDPGDALHREITELFRQLQVIVGQAQGAETAAALNRLKARPVRASAQ